LEGFYEGVQFVLVGQFGEDLVPDALGLVLLLLLFVYCVTQLFLTVLLHFCYEVGALILSNILMLSLVR
jgi:hypothetical protein